MFKSKYKKQMHRYKKLIQISGFFDKIYYLKVNRDARLSNYTPLEHFMKIGLQEDRKPNEDFDPIWYREFYADVKQDGVYPLIHFILFGNKENRFINEQEKIRYEQLKDSFDRDFYKNSYEDLKVQGDDFDFLLHYIRYGEKEGRSYTSPHQLNSKQFDKVTMIDKVKSYFQGSSRRDIDIIEKSNLFDKDYYLSSYIDVKNSGIDPIKHYCEFGWKEFRNPSMSFDTQFYLDNNLDVKRSGINPLVHYIEYGQTEGRKAREDTCYLSQYNDYKKLINTVNTSLNIGVIVHIYYLDLWKEILEKLNSIETRYTLYITTTTELYDDVIKLPMPNNINVKIYSYSNLGMDIYPFVQVLQNLQNDHIDIFCKLHTKKGNEFSGKLWKENLLELTIGNKDIFAGIVQAFSLDSSLKMVGSAFFYKNIQYLIGNNKDYISKILKVLDKEESTLSENGFFAGSMFWGRVDDYVSLSESISDDMFYMDKSVSNSDGSFTHALERVLGLVHNGYKKVGVVYKGNDDDYFLEKLYSSQGSKTNIGETVKRLNSFEYDLKLLNNFRLFDKTLYRLYFPHIHGHNIDCVYHYLTIGRDIYTPSNISDKVLKFFGYNEQYTDMLPFIYLGLKGILAEANLEDNRNLNFEFSKVKTGLYEMHLIDWHIEHQKHRDSSLVSIIIPVYGQTELTKNCLDSILSTDAGLSYEIIVVNNGQDIVDIEMLDRYKKYPNIKIIHNKENLNFALGCNLGFSLSSGGKVVFLNNDTTVTSNWLKNLIAPLKDKNISMTQPRLLYPDGKLQCMGLVFSDKSKLAYPIYQNQDIPQEIINKNRLFNAVTGACLALSADDFALVKGFDTNYINGQEDVDFCLKLNRLKQTKAMYVADSIVYHYEGKSKGRGKFVPNNREIFIKKWGDDIIADDYLHYQSDGVDILEWELDSSVYRDMKIENYIPHIKFGINKKENSKLFIAENSFYIQGKLSFSKKKKTILISAHSVSEQIFGGERSFLDMVQAIDKEQYNLIITLPNKNNNDYIKLLSEDATSLYIVNYGMWSPNGVDEKLVWLLENIMKNENVDLVYSNTIMCREVLFAAKNLSIKKVIHIRELIDRDEHLRSFISLDTQEILDELTELSDYTFVNSKITSDMFNHKNKDIIYNKINTDEYKTVPNYVNPNKINFAMLSSNLPKKGIYDFINIAKLCQDIPNAHFILVGPINEYVQKIQEDIKKLNLKNITIAGYYSNPIDAIKESNVIFSLSHFAESFGRTVGEACAAGRPVIAYNYGAIPELIQEGKNGFLVDYKDIEGVVKYIRLFCSQPTLISTMGDKGREIIEKISSPFVYKSNLNKAIEKCFNLEIEKKHLDVTIIIPIYNAYEEVVMCIDSVINTTAHLNCKIILIDDASPDDRIKPVLKKYGNISNITIIFNETNIGYTNTVNKGIELAKDNDVILLNSDTITTYNWVENLYKTAYSNPLVGTVTAMSDNAGAFSFPESGIANPKPDKMPYNNYANIILRETVKCLPVEVPTGSGFCFFIKRDLINEIGLFDHEAFPRGYGEENDFCMRAKSIGWKNVITPYVFIFHVRTASFGDEKTKLVEEGVSIVLERYPSYLEEVKNAFNSTSIRYLRKMVKKAIEIIK